MHTLLLRDVRHEGIRDKGIIKKRIKSVNKKLKERQVEEQRTKWKWPWGANELEEGRKVKKPLAN